MEKDILNITVDEEGYTKVLYKGTELNVSSINFDIGIDRVATLKCDIIIPTILDRVRKVNIGEKKE